MFKKLSVWLCLLAYLHASAQMAMPLVQDAVAHLLFWHEHLEQVHHGHTHSDHVVQEMQEALQEQNHDDHHDSEHTPGGGSYQGKYILSCHLLAGQSGFKIPKTIDIFITPRIIRYHFSLKPAAGQPLTPPPEQIG